MRDAVTTSGIEPRGRLCSGCADGGACTTTTNRAMRATRGGATTNGERTWTASTLTAHPRAADQSDGVEACWRRGRASRSDRRRTPSAVRAAVARCSAPKRAAGAGRSPGSPVLIAPPSRPRADSGLCASQARHRAIRTGLPLRGQPRHGAHRTRAAPHSRFTCCARQQTPASASVARGDPPRCATRRKVTRRVNSVKRGVRLKNTVKRTKNRLDCLYFPGAATAPPGSTPAPERLR